MHGRMARGADTKRTLTAMALAGVTMLGLGAPAVQADGSASTGTGPSERRLRAIERVTLGPDHAADHAAQRRTTRSEARKPKRRSDPPRRRSATSDDGQWETPRSMPPSLIGIHSVNLPTGKVLFFGNPPPKGAPVRNRAFASLWDPATGVFEDVAPPIDPATGQPANIFCAGASLMADGRVLVTGGNLDYERLPISPRGLKSTYTFDPFTKRWQRHEDMGRGRWYPSQMLMPDGRTYIIEGLDETGAKELDENGVLKDRHNMDMDIFDPAKPGDEISALGTLPVQYRSRDYYPHLFWMPTGRGMTAGPSPRDTWFLLPPGPANVFRHQDAADVALGHTWGTAVLMPQAHDAGAGRVLQLGGASGADFGGPEVRARTSAELYDEAANAWTPQPELNVARGHQNTVLLPDGSMATVGGGIGRGANNLWTSTEAHKQIELYNPATGAWRLGPSQVENRAYHGTAILLADGSVVSAGDESNTTASNDTLEVYKPSYFFRGERPVLNAAPPQAGYGQTMAAGSPDDDVDHAVLIAPGANTHATDMNQRVINLPTRRRADGSGYDVLTPANVNIAPPGFYMLFLVDNKGVPSSAKFVQLAVGAQGQTPGLAAQVSAPAVAAPPAPAPAPVRRGTTGPIGVIRPGAGRGPAARVVVLTRRRRDVARGRLRVRVTLGEAGTASLSIRITGTRSGRRTTTVRWVRQLRFRRAGQRTLVLSLSRTQRRRLADRRLVVSVSARARDRDGDLTRRSVRGRLR